MSGGDGGPAFPRIDGLEPHDHGATHVVSTDGASLRDLFATAALVGYLAMYGHPDSVGAPEEEHAARVAYQYADAMLAERDR